MKNKPTYEELEKRIEELEKNEKFLKEILDTSSSISIICTDLNSNITYWNPGAEKMFGWKSDEIIGKPISLIYPGDRTTKGEMQKLKNVVLKHQSINFEAIEVTKDGEHIIVNMNLAPKIDEDGNTVGIIGIGQNITEYRVAQRRLANIETFSGCLELALPFKKDKSNPIQVLRELLTQTLKSAQEDSYPGYGKLYEIQKNLAAVCYELGEYNGAKELLKQLLESMKTHIEIDHSKMAEIQSNLAMVLYDLGKLEESKDLAQKALDYAVKNFDPDNYIINTRKSNLALVLQELGELEQAEKLSKEAYDSLVHIFGPEHKDTKVAKNNLEVIKKIKELQFEV